MSKKRAKKKQMKKSEAEELNQEEVTLKDIVEEEFREDLPEETPESIEEDTFSLEEKLQNELATAQDQVLRARADFDNFRKRKAREMEQVRKTAAESLIRDILPAIDNLDLALQHAEDTTTGLAQGVSMVNKQLLDVLVARGLSPIDALGAPFDPNVHEAMTKMPSDEFEEDHVMQEFQKGYTLNDTVLRPSKVVVSAGKADSDEPAEDTASAE